VVKETDLKTSDGRMLHVYDATAGDTDAQLAVVWHHGTPNIGAPPEPLLRPAKKRGIRWVSYDRPGYGGSTPHPGRDVASAAADVSSVVDALGIGTFAVMGHSGGSTHALACAALLPERVLGAACVSGLAPFHAEGLDWFAGGSRGARGHVVVAGPRRCAGHPRRSWRDDR
jgi:pimeloyl-ACP methyl ester carboxylesterase